MKKTKVIFSILKGIAVAVAITIIGVMILALITKETDGNFISLISVTIKLLSIIVGTVIASLDLKKRGALVGILVSFPYWIICILLSLLAAPIQFDIKMIFDFILTVIIGMFAGVLIVNVRK